MCTSIVPYLREIKLTQGKVALVGWWWYEWLNQWKWYAQKKPHTFYAHRSIKNKRVRGYISIHRLILNPKDKLVDHEDHNGLNNLPHNIRKCTSSQNNINRKPRGKSKYLGVSFLTHKRNGKEKSRWTAFIKNKETGKNKNLGEYLTEVEAAIAYNHAAKIYHGIFANINIIDPAELAAVALTPVEILSPPVALSFPA